MENLKKESNKTHFIQFQLFIFYKPRLFTESFSQGIFLGQALRADCVSPRTKTIASRDQLRPIWIGEDSVVNYNTW